MTRGDNPFWAGAGAGVAALTLGLLGCGADDRTMDDPSASQTTTTFIRGTTASTAAADAPAAAFQLTSAAFAPNAVIPDRYTCDGMDAAPDLAWANLPAGTVELAIVMDDPDADGFVHWVVAGLDPATSGIAENQVPEGAVEARNGFGDPGWAGPCPPDGSGVHHYNFQLVALGAPLDLDPGLEARDAAEAVFAGQVLGTAALTGTVDAG
jgi:Raf kinase inhibitor-like YbhB/YbcL family protein